MNSKITAIGIANPIHRRSQSEVAGLIAEICNLNQSQKRALKKIYHASGIDFRHSVINDYTTSEGNFEFFPKNSLQPFPSTAARMTLYKASALPLAFTAIDNCLKELTNFDKKDITHLITISCTGMYAPGLDIEIVQQLGLQSSTKRTAINFMGCYGAFNGMKVADAFCKADPQANVLVVSVELCTLHFKNEFSLENVVSNALFADGAAAVLIQGHTKQDKFLEIETFYCDLLPESQQEMAWSIADSGFDMVLSSYIPKMIKSGIKYFIDTLCKEAKISIEAIDYYAIHPGGVKILQACEDSLNITPQDNQHSYEVLRNYGNMSSATVLFVLKSIWDNLKKESADKKIFSCAFGPGLTLESVLLNIQFLK